MSAIMFYTLLSFCLFGPAFGQVFRVGKCPTIKAMPDFDMDKYLGKWHMMVEYRDVSNDHTKCLNYNYTRDEDGTVRLIQESINRSSGIRSRRPGILEPSKSGEPGKLLFSFFPVGPTKGDFMVLDTDYVSYAITYNCLNGALANCYENVYVYTRDQHPSGSVIARSAEFTDAHKFARKNFKEIAQDDCELRPSRDYKPTTTSVV